MKTIIQPFPITRTSPGWLPVMVCGCLMVAGLLLGLATAADLVGW